METFVTACWWSQLRFQWLEIRKETVAYLRERADRCLKLAALISDGDAARDLAQEAGKLLAEAAKVESRWGPGERR
jgi:hypothetical protein